LWKARVNAAAAPSKCARCSGQTGLAARELVPRPGGVSRKTAMEFDATPLNITTLLVIVLAIMALVFLIRGRHDSNLPLLFYGAVLGLTATTDRTVNTYLLYAGIASALLLRFEFMGKGVTKFISFLTSFAICAIVAVFLDQIFADGRLFS
jgi:hypothetical protein